MLPRCTPLWALLCLLICLHVAAASRLPMPRQEASTTTDASKTTDTVKEKPLESSSSASSTASSTTTAISSIASTLVLSATQTAINGVSPATESYNATSQDGELPLEPRITPGLGVAGVILMLTGTLYTLGIKSTWLHTFFSTAYLASLGTTVLIVYVMTLPVSDAIQGAYVVAVICAGAILGGGATVFKELTEGLGCLLGGFCLSMWLLTLADGGLLTNIPAKVIFITCFSIGGFAFYFSRFTRVYALIGFTSFTGATVTVLGVDCFSRAGLKEFWAYIWDLNNQLFPMGAETYPITRGIRVEIALTIIIYLIGVCSQLKLWKIIQERRAKRAEAQAEAQRDLDIEEANVGQQIEEQNARERRQWDATYGDKSAGSVAESKDSRVEELGEKARRDSHKTSSKMTMAGNVIELDELPDSASHVPPALSPKESSNGLIVPHERNESRITIRVATDDEVHEEKSHPPSILEEEKKDWVIVADCEARPATRTTVRDSKRLSNGPDIVPLPFAIPGQSEKDDDEQSSIAALADEDDGVVDVSKGASRYSPLNRLSVQSGNLRGFSQHSKNKREVSPNKLSSLSREMGESHEDLVYETRKTEDDTRSVAATLDDMSDDMSLDGNATPSTVADEEKRNLTETVAALADSKLNAESSVLQKHLMQPQAPESGHLLTERPYSTADTVATNILDESSLDIPSGTVSKRSSSSNAVAKTEATKKSHKTEPTMSDCKSDCPRMPNSVATSVESPPASLTKDRLPTGLSRVALSYRTNEWAKHLSQAEMPQPEKLQVFKCSAQDTDTRLDETSAPVDMESLRQTAENGVPAPVGRKSPSAISGPHSTNSPTSRSNSRTSASPPPPASSPVTNMPGRAAHNQDSNARASPVNAAPPNLPQTSRMKPRHLSLLGQPIAEENDDEQLEQPGVQDSQLYDDTNGSDQVSRTASPVYFGRNSPAPILGVVSYSSPQTLLGQREMYIRSKPHVSVLGPPSSGVRCYSPQPPNPGAPSSEIRCHSPQLQNDTGSHYNTPAYSSLMGQDVDDIPLSQRKQIIRQSSRASLVSHGDSRPSSGLSIAYVPRQSISPTPQAAAEGVPFDSHQPQRYSALPSQSAREARLASFRQSVAQDLQASPPILPVTAGGRASPSPFPPGSMTSLIEAVVSTGKASRDAEIRRSLDQGRNMMLNQREQEAQRKELERWERKRTERAFEERVRSGNLIDAHRKAMRKMQSSAREKSMVIADGTI